MTQGIDEISVATSTKASDLTAESAALGMSADDGGFFQRQLVAAGLVETARKIAQGCRLDGDDALGLTQASLPLLGRIVHLVPSDGNETDEPAAAALPIERLAEGCQLPRQYAQPLTGWEIFCRTLLATWDELAAVEEAAVWYPQVTRPPDEDHSADEGFTGVDVLRAIALARLLLPPRVRIAAPLATLGPKLAQVALDFGASHLGYLTDGGVSLNNPLVADPHMLHVLQGDCAPTLPREEPQT